MAEVTEGRPQPVSLRPVLAAHWAGHAVAVASGMLAHPVELSLVLFLTGDHGYCVLKLQWHSLHPSSLN